MGLKTVKTCKKFIHGMWIEQPITIKQKRKVKSFENGWFPKKRVGKEYYLGGCI